MSKWHSVVVKLPKHNYKDYVVYCLEDDSEHVAYMDCHGNWTYSISNKLLNSFVTHWKKLGKGPEE